MLNIFAPEVAIAEMEALATKNTRSADSVFNCILSWCESEIPTREQADGAVDVVLKELGLDGCLCHHYALHRNTGEKSAGVSVRRRRLRSCVRQRLEKNFIKSWSGRVSNSSAMAAARF